MSQTYFAILTAIGEAKLANATALGTTLQLTQMGVGDGNGSTPLPNRSQTTLVRENRRAPLNRLFVDPANASQIIAEQVIPEEIGGWWIREIGLYDTDGNLCAVANCPDTYKPVLAEGSGRTQVIRMVLIVSNTAAVQLKIDPAIVLATRGYVDDEFGKHLAHLDPHPQYMTAPEVASAISGKADKATTLAGYAIGNAIGFYATVPSIELEPVIYVAPFGLMAWHTSLNLYRSLGCGEILLHASATPKPGTLKANGALISKTTYAGLWGWAQENSLVVTAAAWSGGAAKFADESSGQFRLPDLRGEFLRSWDDGRGADSSRLLGTPQAATQMIADAVCVGTGNGLGPVVDRGNLQTGFDATVQAFNGLSHYHIPNNWIPAQGQPGGNDKVSAVVTTGSVRPRNTALLACIKY